MKQDQPSSDSFYDSDNTEGEAGTSAGASGGGAGGRQRTISGSQADEDVEEEEVDGQYLYCKKMKTKT